MKGISYLYCLLVVVVAVLPWTMSQPLTLEVNTQTGEYSLLFNGKTWLTSAGTAVHSNGIWYASVDADINGPHSLVKVTQNKTISGQDQLGPYNGTELQWTSVQSSSIQFYTSFKWYTRHSTVGFGLRVPHPGLPKTATGDNTDVVTGFPTFALPTSPKPSSLAYFTYLNTFAPIHIGNWDSASSFQGGANGGVPFTLFEPATRQTFVISPIVNYMVGVQAFSKSIRSSLACGLQGMIAEIPGEFYHETIVHAGTGITDTLHSWGDLLLKKGGKHRTEPNADIFIEYLSYYTDNGAYYYYLTEPGKNYQQTILDVNTYVRNVSKIPVVGYQFDSWWYFQESSTGALLLWEARPDVFPDGMAYVDSKLGYPPLTLHNRYFANNNDYIKMGYQFIIENAHNMALPIDENLFRYIMGLAQRWGLSIYEQDWLVTTYMSMDATQNNVTNARTWLMAMGNAAESLGLKIQYCMPLPLHLLQSTEIKSVTQVRVTDDYQPGNRNWRIGYTSLLHWSLGVIPFKDDFWTNETEETGCRYSSGCVEPNPDLVSLVACLSTGPVGPSDKIGMLNRDRVIRSCNADGLLLKPDKPPTPLDTVFVENVKMNDLSVKIEVWDTLTVLNEGASVWHYIVAADSLASGFVIMPADLKGIQQGYVFDWYAAVNTKQITLANFTSRSPLVIPNLAAAVPLNHDYKKPEDAATKIDFRYYVIAPIFGNGWSFLGETTKYVTVSKQRVEEVVEGQNGSGMSWVDVKVVGAIGEQVTLSFVTPMGKVVTVQCTIDSQFEARAHCDNASHSTCVC